MIVTHHTSHSFSYLSSLPLVTDPIAVASNDCARDRLHKDRCAQAFGRNILSKPHTTPRSQPMSSYPLYSSLMFHHSQVPCPAMIPIIPMLGQEADHSRKPSAISENGNEAAVFDLSAPCYLDDQKSSILEGSLSINSSHLILTSSTHLFLFQQP